MSDDDLLDRATRALRDESRAGPRDLAATRARLLADARRSRVHVLGARARVVRWVVPLAAVLALGTAYAAATGQLRTFFGLGRGREVPPTTTVASAPASTGPVTPPGPSIVASADTAPSSAPSSAASTVASAVASTAPSGSASASSAVASGVASAPSVAPPKPSVSASNDAHAAAMAADLASYRKAHALHFVEKRWDAALGAWNEYLADHGKGTFVVEARYNRAICLVKLGRKADARMALQPFADGVVAGGYRKDEAKALLDALDAP